MGYRAIQDTTPLSESLAGVSYLAECLFWRILSQTDDCGRLAGSAAKIRVSCMGLRAVTVDEVEEALEELVRVGRVTRACVDGEWVCQVTDFEANQPPGLLRRPRPSRFPPIPQQVSVDSRIPPQEKRGEEKRREEDQHLAAHNRAASNRSHPEPRSPVDATESARTGRANRSAPGQARQSARTGRAASAQNGRRGRRKDPLFDAMTDAVGIDPAALTETGRGAVNRALRDLRDVGATPETVRERAGEFRRRFSFPLTAMALAKHWASLGAPAPERRARPFGRGVTAAEMAAAAESLDGFASFAEFDQRNVVAGDAGRVLDAAG